MKHFYTLAAVLLGIAATSQTINIPDVNFKNALLETNPDVLNATDANGNYIVVDVNADGQIQQSEALAVYTLYVPFMNITDLTGIQAFTNLEYLDITYNEIPSLNLSNLSNLMYLVANDAGIQNLELSGCIALNSLELDYNLLSSLDLSGLTNLETVIASNNNLSAINISNLPNLSMLEVHSNFLTTIDFTGSPSLGFVSVAYNELTAIDMSMAHPQDLYVDGNPLQSLNIKNGFDDSDANITFYDTPIEYLCVDPMETAAFLELLEWFEMNISVNSYCTFTPGGTYYTVHGNSTIDDENDGCDSNDNAYPDLKLLINDGTTISTLIADGSGDYTITVPEGAYTVTPVFENPEYFNVFPQSIGVSFPTDASPYNQNFCVSPNGFHPDVEITLLPLDAAVPGFDATYRIVCKNIGNQLMSGTITLNFDNDVIDVLSSEPAPTDQSENMIYWDFNDLSPFQSREITVVMNLNAPTETPPLNIDDILAFSASVTTVVEDENPENNTFAFDELVVGSFDPNDITCLEGEVVSTEIIGDYVHYMIRFENTGTFPAQNIVVRNMIDLSKFDISSLTPITGSHSFITRISDGNLVEFKFEDIQLPFADNENDGYVAYKIKLLNTLAAGNTFSNQAGIYFDYNFPVETNTYVTTIQALGTPDFEFSAEFSLWPIPATSQLNIDRLNGLDIASVQVYSSVGQLLISLPDFGMRGSIDVSMLASGNYFIKMNTTKGVAVSQFIKN